jgi:hypothetical protein
MRMNEELELKMLELLGKDNLTVKEFFDSWETGDLVHYAPFEVKFLKSFCDDDFVEKGMKSVLTGIKKGKDDDYELYFYFDHHMEYNKCFFHRSHENMNQKEGEDFFLNAIENKQYEGYYSVYTFDEANLYDHIAFLKDGTQI